METRVFNSNDAVVPGWYWVAKSKALRRGRVIAVRLLGRDLAVYRGDSGKVVALDAYCAHMGAHLAEGRVEGDGLRCFFHRWRYEQDGRCSDIPCLNASPSPRMRVRSWPIAERYGLIWVWTGEQPAFGVPEVPELAGQPTEAYVANRFFKRCHPNVVLINAIDEQHFASVHHLPGSVLTMEAIPRTTANIEFHNTGHVPTDRVLSRFFARFYQGALTYNMSYWYGSVGTVTIGPDFLHLHLMFALRRLDDGSTEGQTIALTKQRDGFFGKLFNAVILRVTAIAARYFAYGDTRVFETIRFNLQNPIAADRAVVAFIRHLEAQPVCEWAESATAQTPARTVTRLRVANANDNE